MAVTTYAIPSGRIVHETKVDFSYRSVQKPIHVVQYDKQLPIIAVTLYVSGKLYTLPANFDVNVKFGKRDKTFVYKPVLGCNADRTVVYFEMDEQMTFIYGPVSPILELSFADGDNVQRAGSSPIAIEIERNPIQETDIESSNQYLDLHQAITDAQAALSAFAEVNIVEKVNIDGADLTPDVDKRITLPDKEPAFEKNTAFNKNFGNEDDTVCEGNDVRLSDARTPLSHTHDDRYYTESEVDTLLDDIRDGAGAAPEITLPPNRLIYCDINNNYTYINPTRLETMSKIAYFKVKNGNFNGYYNNTGIKWTFPAGTVVYETSTPILTSTNDLINVTITAASGYVILYSNTWIGVCTLSLQNNLAFTGSLADLPAVTHNLSLAGCSLITGDLSDLPAVTFTLNLNGCSLITGDLSDLPVLTNFLGLNNCSLITGAYVSVSGNNVPEATRLTGTGLSATDMDNTLIAYAACTKNNGEFTATNKNRTAASDDAVAALVTRHWSINGLIKI